MSMHRPVEDGSSSGISGTGRMWNIDASVSCVNM